MSILLLGLLCPGSIYFGLKVHIYIYMYIYVYIYIYILYIGTLVRRTYTLYGSLNLREKLTRNPVRLLRASTTARTSSERYPTSVWAKLGNLF